MLPYIEEYGSCGGKIELSYSISTREYYTAEQPNSATRSKKGRYQYRRIRIEQRGEIIEYETIYAGVSHR